MLIQITNTCHMGCSHCLQDSTPAVQHMDAETVEKAYAFCKRCNVMNVLISGGEPTEHPDFEAIVRKFIEFPAVSIISNGSWIGDVKKVAVIRSLLKEPNVFLQVTSIGGIYKNYDLVKKYEKRILSLGKRVTVHTDKIYIHALGRARYNEKWLERSREHGYVMSCFQHILTYKQLPFLDALHNEEKRGHFCSPLIDWKGRLHFSESWLCPSFATLDDDFDEIARKAAAWTPCGACPDYQKLLAKTEPIYVNARVILGIENKS